MSTPQQQQRRPNDHGGNVVNSDVHDGVFPRRPHGPDAHGTHGQDIVDDDIRDDLHGPDNHSEHGHDVQELVNVQQSGHQPRPHREQDDGHRERDPQPGQQVHHYENGSREEPFLNLSHDIFRDTSPTPPSDTNADDDDEDYFDLLYQFSKEWLSVQLTHQVSLSAADAFWKLALKFMPRIIKSKGNNNVRRKIPKFQNQRRMLYRQLCPRIGMNFAYKDNDTDMIKLVNNVETTPRKHYEQNPRYTKLYEAAFVKVTFFTPSTMYLIYLFTFHLLSGE